MDYNFGVVILGDNMSIVSNYYFKPGDKPTAAQLNAPYNAMVAAKVDDINTSDNWANREHFDELAPKKINNLVSVNNDTNTAWLIPNGPLIWTTIDNTGAKKTEVTPNYTCEGGALIRVQASGLVGDIVIDPGIRDGDGTAAQGLYNCYSFRIFATFNGGATTQSLASCTYSLTQKAEITTNAVSAVVRNPIEWRSFALSGCFYVNPGTVIDKIELQAKIGNTSQQVFVQHNHLHLIIAET